MDKNNRDGFLKKIIMDFEKFCEKNKNCNEYKQELINNIKELSSDFLSFEKKSFQIVSEKKEKQFCSAIHFNCCKNNIENKYSVCSHTIPENEFTKNFQDNGKIKIFAIDSNLKNYIANSIENFFYTISKEKASTFYGCCNDCECFFSNEKIDFLTDVNETNISLFLYRNELRSYFILNENLNCFNDLIKKIESNSYIKDFFLNNQYIINTDINNINQEVMSLFDLICEIRKRNLEDIKKSQSYIKNYFNDYENIKKNCSDLKYCYKNFKFDFNHICSGIYKLHTNKIKYYILFYAYHENNLIKQGVKIFSRDKEIDMSCFDLKLNEECQKNIFLNLLTYFLLIFQNNVFFKSSCVDKINDALFIRSICKTPSCLINGDVFSEYKNKINLIFK